MKVYIKGCFKELAYELSNYLLDEGYYVIGYDSDVENDEEKFERYALIGRNANFQLEHNISSKYDVIYDFITNEHSCIFTKEKEIYSTIDFNKDERLSTKIDTQIKVLSLLLHCSLIPKSITMDWEEKYGFWIIRTN